MPNIVTVIGDVLNDLKWNDGLSSKIEICDLERNIAIYFTLNKIVYFNNIEKSNDFNRPMGNDMDISYKYIG